MGVEDDTREAESTRALQRAARSPFPVYPHVALTCEDGIAIVTLDRREALNALNDQLIDSLNACLARLHDDREIRVILLKANGRHFCAGVDLKTWRGELERPSVSNAMQMQTKIGAIVRRMRAMPQPIIALGHGAACGGGFSLLLAADVRYGTPDLRMNAAYAKVGLGGCDIGSSYLLPRLVGGSLASELLLTGRFLTAERALAFGLISEIVAPDALLEAGLRLAHEMLAVAPMALRLTKDVLNINANAPSLDAAMALEDRQQVMLTSTHDHEEAVSAFLEKRAPAFLDR